MPEEIFDVVDHLDNIIGYAKRSEVHGNPDLIHRVAHVLIFNSKGDLFLQKRSRNKDVQPGKWDTSVGGHLDRGESYDEAAKREMKEELGIEPSNLSFLYKYQHTNNYESEYVSTYKATWDGPIHTNPEEIEDGKFWSLSEIEQSEEEGWFTPNFLDELKRYIEHSNNQMGIA